MFSPTDLFPYSPPLSPPSCPTTSLARPPLPPATTLRLCVSLPITSHIAGSVASPSTASLTWSSSSCTTTSSRSAFSSKSSSSSATTMTAVLPPVTRPDMFEQIFSRLEAESEQRAREEEERERLEAEAEGRPTWQEVADELLPPTNANTIRTTRERRRTSISVSRYGGQPPESPTSTRPPSTRPSRSSSIVLTRQNFYQLDARHPSGSADSFASSTADAADMVEEPSFTQQMVFSPKQSISKAISRRLSRARDIMPLPSPTSNGSLLVGVAVEEAVSEHRAAAGDDSSEHSSKAEVYSGTLRTQRSTPGMRDRAAATWVNKAKDMTLRFRRKSVAVLNAAPLTVVR